jgi:hypothetical protein
MKNLWCRATVLIEKREAYLEGVARTVVQGNGNIPERQQHSVQMFAWK